MKQHNLAMKLHLKTLALWLAAAAVLALVFSAYLQPNFIFDLGNRFFMCF